MKVFISDGCVGFYGYMAESRFFLLLLLLLKICTAVCSGMEG